MTDRSNMPATTAHQVVSLILTVSLTVGATVVLYLRERDVVGPAWHWWGWALMLAIVGFFSFLTVAVVDFAAATLADWLAWRRRHRSTLPHGGTTRFGRRHPFRFACPQAHSLPLPPRLRPGAGRPQRAGAKRMVAPTAPPPGHASRRAAAKVTTPPDRRPPHPGRVAEHKTRHIRHRDSPSAPASGRPYDPLAGQ